jgi:PAS domain S-box-containing protein
VPSDYYLNIRRRFVTGVTVVVLVLAGLFYWYGARERQLVIVNAEKNSASYASALKEHAERVFSEADNTLKDLQEEIGENGGISYAQSARFYKRLNERATPFSSVYVVDKQGDIVAHSQEYRMKSVNLADRDYFLHHRDNPASGLFISKPFNSKVSNTWRFSLSRSLRDAQGNFIGLVSVTFETDYFENFYKTIDLGTKGRIILATTAGEILVLEPKYEKTFAQNFKSSILFSSYLKSSPYGTHSVLSPISNEMKIMSYRELTNIPVVAVASYDEGDVTAVWLAAVYKQLLIAVLLLLLFCVLSLLFLKQVRKLGQANLKLEEQQSDLELKAALLDAASDSILLLDSQGEFVYFNNALQVLTGYDRAELKQRGLFSIQPPENGDQIQLNIAMLQERGEAIFESTYLCKSGRVVPIEGHARVVTVNDRSLILSLVRDISERKEIEQRLVDSVNFMKKAERREQVRSGILERVVGREPLSQMLEYIVISIEKENPGMLCSILLVSDDGTRLLNGAAPSLPEAYHLATNRTKIGEGIGSCGTAAFRRERVIVEDIDNHPFWKGFVPAQEAGLRSCWSEPIFASSGQLLGTFAIYHRTPETPGEDEISLIQQASVFAGIAIERNKSESERVELESLLSQAKKMEAIGHLTGGIAHDFNNLLTPILIYSDILKRSLPDSEKLRAALDGIIKASGKARDLTQQLLSFGRKQVMQMQVVDLNEVISSFYSIARSTLRENITLTLQLASQPVVVRADSAKLEQVLLNLVLNAQDAAEGAGTIVFETGQVLIDDEFARRHPGMNAGRFVLLSCSDNGCGMDSETLARIFEPFFSTKSVGHGTGLGLANVYGIIKQHNGYILAVSRVGSGTVFKIFIPVCNEQPQLIGDERVAISPDCHGQGVILVVEDNDMIRVMTTELLKGFGYTVYDSGGPLQALELLREIPEPVDLVISDIMMPGMNGQQLYEQIAEEHPEINKVLFMSGYTNNVVVTVGEQDDGRHFLQKPFTVDALMSKVKAMLPSGE